MQIQKESVSDIWHELQPLLEQHFEEISANPDIPLEVEYAKYEAMENAGSFILFTAREDGALIGYAAYFIAGNLHYSSSKQATQDVLFLRKDKRKGFAGIKLIKFADKVLAENGVQVVYHHVKVAHNFGLILERMGYNKVEYIYSKRLDKG